MRVYMLVANNIFHGSYHARGKKDTFTFVAESAVKSRAAFRARIKRAQPVKPESV